MNCKGGYGRWCAEKMGGNKSGGTTERVDGKGDPNADPTLIEMKFYVTILTGCSTLARSRLAPCVKMHEFA